jgi:hypothetical protein
MDVILDKYKVKGKANCEYVRYLYIYGTLINGDK